MEKWAMVKALTFDLFGTILDLGGSLTPFIAGFLKARGSESSPTAFGSSGGTGSGSSNTRTTS